MKSKVIKSIKTKMSNVSITATCFAMTAAGVPLDALAQAQASPPVANAAVGNLNATSGSLIGNVITPAITTLKWGSYLAGGVFVMMGLLAAYKKSHSQGGSQVEAKEIFVPLIVGGLLLSIGTIISVMSNSMNTASTATSTGF